MFPGDVWRCGCGRAWAWTEDGVWRATFEPELTGQERDLLAAAGLMPAPTPAPSAEHYRREASEMAHRIRDLLRAEHTRCRNPACALAMVWAEDVQEILDARERLVAREPPLVAVCTCTGWMSERGPDTPDPACPVHGEQGP
jgi:hypothetical protein